MQDQDGRPWKRTGPDRDYKRDGLGGMEAGWLQCFFFPPLGFGMKKKARGRGMEAKEYDQTGGIDRKRREGETKSAVTGASCGAGANSSFQDVPACP